MFFEIEVLKMQQKIVVNYPIHQWKESFLNEDISVLIKTIDNNYLFYAIKIFFTKIVLLISITNDY